VSTPALDAAEVIAAVGRWNFIPENAIRVETEEYLVLRLPDWFDQPLELRWIRPHRPLDAVLDEVLEGCARTELPHVCCWVRMDPPDGVEDAFIARGGRLDETLDVLARSLADGGPAVTVPDGVELRWAADPQTFADSMRIGAIVFGGEDDVSEDVVAEEFTRAETKRTAVGGGSLVAYVDGEPVATGSLTLEGPDARLWGGAVLEGFRGRGLYQALLAERLRYAVQCGSELALVKGRVQTSGPILRRAGFEVFGQERSYLVPLGG